MRIQSMTKIWIAKFLSENVYGEQVGGYTNLSSAYANVQYMTNDIEFQTYGEITNSVITIRLNDYISGIDKGDYLYLNEPKAVGAFTIGDTSYVDYGKGEYIIESVKPAYIGSKVVKNRTYITARKVM